MRLDSPETNTIKNESPLLLPISIVPLKKKQFHAQQKSEYIHLLHPTLALPPKKKKNGTSTSFPNSCGPLWKANKWQEPSSSG